MSGEEKYGFVPKDKIAEDKLKERELAAIEGISVSLHTISAYLQMIAECCEKGVLQMRDVDRAKVYGEHLGKKLRPKKKVKRAKKV